MSREDYNRHETKADWPTETVENMTERMATRHPDWAPLGTTRGQLETEMEAQQ